jgi:hypothetical protein
MAAPAQPCHAGARSAPGHRRAGVTDRWPPCYSGRGGAESQMLMRGPRSTVRAAVELYSKKKFQVRLNSNGFKLLHILTASNRIFPGSKIFK